MNDFYRDALARLRDAEIPHLVGGAYAMRVHTGIERDTKDLDVFVRRADVERALKTLGDAGHRTELTSSVWIAKAFGPHDALVDLIFGGDNGIGEVDDLWFEHSVDATVLGVSARAIPAEELIWSKAFIMGRQRYDGADVAHVLRAKADELDWTRLLMRFGPNWRVLAAHLVLFGFIYPGERTRIPASVMEDLLRRLDGEAKVSPDGARVCRGGLLSRDQYRVDIERWGYHDARAVTRI